jgi:hypothetical protein
MHQNYDNHFKWVCNQNLLSELEQDENVYRGYFTPIHPESRYGAVECVDDFITRMLDTYRPYEEGTWLIDDEDMFMERGILMNGYEEWNFDEILDCDKMGAEVLKIIEDMKRG